MVRAIVEVKKAAAITNRDVGAIDARIANAMIDACDDILGGGYEDQFIVDAVQGGAGTSLNMNANEVISNRAIELLGGRKGDYSIVHPNDHANCAQSTNDAYPSAGKIATIRLLDRAIIALERLTASVLAKAEEYSNVIKMGRTEMQDAVPISFGQVFTAYSEAFKRDIKRFALAKDELSVMNMGGTAIGTGLNALPEYIDQIVGNLSAVTGLDLTLANDLIDSTQNLDVFVFVSGIVKSAAVSLSKMANDLRLMSSGPRCGLGEITLPARQNGSSIMPGKVNPVIPEVVSQIAFNVIGNDTTITMAAEAGQLELNAFEPILFYCLFENLDMLARGAEIFAKDCIDGIVVNRESCRDEVERSIGIVTALCPKLGYARSAKIAKQALREGRYVRDVILEETDLSSDEVDALLDPRGMV
jgi:aspartate ammonia-lyase